MASRWSSRLSVDGAAQAGTALDAQVVAVDLDPRAQRAQARGDPGDPVGFLVAQLAGAADRRSCPSAWPRPGTGPGSRRSRRRRRRGRGRSPWSSDERTTQVGDRLADVIGHAASAARPVAPRCRRPSRRSRSMIARRVGLTPTPRRRQLGVGMDRAGDQPERGRRDVARDALIDRLHRRPPCDRPGHRPIRSVASAPRATPRARSIRSVWSRVATDSRTVVRPSARRPASRIADFTWALGHRRREVDRRERGTPDHGQGRKGIVAPGAGAPRPSRAAAR